MAIINVDVQNRITYLTLRANINDHYQLHSIRRTVSLHYSKVTCSTCQPLSRTTKTRHRFSGCFARVFTTQNATKLQ